MRSACLAHHGARELLRRGGHRTDDKGMNPFHDGGRDHSYRDVLDVLTEIVP